MNNNKNNIICFKNNAVPAIQYLGKEYPLNSCILMKVGSHGIESFSDILHRKEKENKNHGFMLWGYSGNLLNATETRKYFESQKTLSKKFFIFMIETKSPFRNSPEKSKYFSIDRSTWYELPEGLYTTGCDKAVICKNLNKTEFKFDLSKFLVASGASKGKNAGSYLKFRTDKACIEFSNSEIKKDPVFVTINWVAEILPPYTVYLSKNDIIQHNLFSTKINKSRLGVFRNV